MTEGRRPPVPKSGGVRNDQATVMVEPTTTDVESARKEFRQRWELASVLHFLNVFEPVIENDLKMSAEEIETALIEPNSALAHLHKVLLKGILPANKPLRVSHCWISALRKELAPWWHWVAEGDFPLAEAKGKEMPIYNELDPTARLLILKALCEVRADQPDVGSYMKEAMDNGTEVSAFRKHMLAGDGKGIAFWYDGNESIGHRLYKEVYFFETSRAKGKASVLSMNCEWKTLATNLEEFNEVVNEFSTSGVEFEVALGKSIEADVIPILKKHLKKRQRVQQKLKLRDQILPMAFRCSGTRSCRNQKPIDYTYDDFDRAIREAIQYTNERKTSDYQREEEKQSQRVEMLVTTSQESYNFDTNSRDGESSDSDGGKNNNEGSDDAGGSSHEEYEKQKEDDGTKIGERRRKVHPEQQNLMLAHRSKNLRFSKRLAGVPGNTIPESMKLDAKKRMRQMPSVNTAVETVVAPDLEDENHM